MTKIDEMDLEIQDLQQKIVNLYILEQRISVLEMSTDIIKLTNDEAINKKLIVYFWWLIVLSFIGQLIGYLIQWISGTISPTVLLILALGAIQTLLIGGAVKLVQKQVEVVSDQSNSNLAQLKTALSENESLKSELAELKKQLNDRDAELIALKTKDQQV